MASIMSNEMKYQMFSQLAGVGVISGTIKVALCTSALAPDPETHRNYSDITNELATGGGYTSGGATLTGKTLTVDTGANVAIFDANDTTWATSTITNARYAVVYLDSGTPSTSPVIDILDFLADKSSSGTDFVVQFNASGIARAA